MCRIHQVLENFTNTFLDRLASAQQSSPEFSTIDIEHVRQKALASLQGMKKD